MRKRSFRRRMLPRLAAGLCMALLTLMLLPCAGADTTPYLEPDKPSTLTVQHITPGIAFRLYRVADVDDSIAFTPVAPFDRYSIDFRRNMTAAEWQILANTLASYAVADSLTPLAQALTDDAGEIRWSDLQAGLYLVMADSYDADEYIYTVNPTLISLPNLQDDGRWQYDVTIGPKWSVKPIERIDLEVVKIWKDEDSAVVRPDSITVELYGNGVLMDTVILSQANNWRYHWTGLDNRITWTVVERGIPEEYKVTIDPQGDVVIITNDAPSMTTPVPDLPQTGQTWWPVPLLALGGMALFILGWTMRRQGGK
ncbi:MAG: Cna B-type domain-containing protein [Aristaeellaceae bacterium]